MKPVIVLDSGPLGLLFQREGIPLADQCRQWFRAHRDAGIKFLVPEIVDYELRRELLRLRLQAAARLLHEFNHEAPGRFNALNSSSLLLAAELWARARQQGKPTADAHALDVDVILAAQVLSAGHDPPAFVVATTNVTHLSQFVPAEEWTKI